MIAEASTPDGGPPVCSRLVVKGLPAKFSQLDVRELFKDFGLITDCQLKLGANGVSRRFAFVGFQNDDEAKAAKEHLHNSFVGASRVLVEYCRPYSAAKADPRKPSERQKAAGSLTLHVDCGQRVKKKSLHQFLAPVQPVKILHVADTTAVAVLLSKRSEVSTVLKLNGTFLAGRRVAVTQVADRAAGDDTTTKQNDDARNIDYKPETVEDVRKNAQTISESGCLFVRNLPYICTVHDLRQVFESFGPVAEVSLPVDQQTQRPKGFALLKYVFPEHALKAYTTLDGSVFRGRLLHILPGNEAVNLLPTSGQQEVKAVKSKKEKELIEKTVRGVNWNTLFLGANAVADVLSEELGTTKSDVLDPMAKSSLGVRMALGETHIVADTRRFLLQNGVDLEKFADGNVKRSETVILVKNLPARTGSQEIRHVFEKYGRLGRVVLPPSGVTAMVEFLNSQDAAKAFKAQISKRFKSSPLYLEWAPDAVFKSQFSTAKAHTGTSAEEATDSTSANLSDIESHRNTLFVKGLDFATSDEVLAKHFKRIGPLVYATVAKKSNPSKAGELLSMGYGFVQYAKADDASRALKELQNSVIDGRTVTLKLSERETLSSKPSEKFPRPAKRDHVGKEVSNTTILVRNIPFQANKREIASIFKTFGELRTVRLPRKTQSKDHRGFGFVDFLSKADAEAAFSALCYSTHLYGRRLVLEWASVGSDLAELRKRTADYFTDAKVTSKQSRVLLEESLK